MERMDQPEIETGAEAEAGRPDWRRPAAVFLVLVVSLALNQGVRDGAARLRRAATAQLMSEATHRINLTSPHSGEISLTEPILHGIEMLRANDIENFRLSSAMSEEAFVEQRLIEGAWPIRFDTNSNFLVAYLNEPTDCTRIDQLEFDPRWRIPRRQTALFAGRRGIQLARCP
jgi:hypothetical protein